MMHANLLSQVEARMPGMVNNVHFLQARKEGRKIYSSLAASKADRME